MCSLSTMVNGQARISTWGPLRLKYLIPGNAQKEYFFFSTSGLFSNSHVCAFAQHSRTNWVDLATDFVRRDSTGFSIPRPFADAENESSSRKEEAPHVKSSRPQGPEFRPFSRLRCHGHIARLCLAVGKRPLIGHLAMHRCVGQKGGPRTPWISVGLPRLRWGLRLWRPQAGR